MSQSRRAFLARASTAATVGMLAQLPSSRLWAVPPSELLPDPDEAALRELALTAINAARAAGAVFADIRISGGRRLSVGCKFERQRTPDPTMGPPSFTLTFGYGIRAIVDGAWGIASGYALMADDVAATARTAVARARANRPRHPHTLELAPAPRVESGRWATPIERDPFTIPAGEQADLQLAALAPLTRLREIQVAAVGFTWQRTDRVFASSEGTVQVQRLDLALPSTQIVARTDGPHTYAFESAEALQGGGYGYEAVTRIDLREELRQAADRAIAESRTLTPLIPADVGRYDLVLAAGSVAALLTSTVVEAVNAERVLGYRANHEGTSFAAPPGEVLGSLEVGAERLTVRADRSRPHALATVGWDDEGVAPDDFTFIQDGVLVDYHTTRQTAPAFAAWYRSRGAPVRSHGCASGAGQQTPSVQLPNLTMQPGRDEVAVDELIADTKRGFYLDGVWGGSDQQLLNNQFRASVSAREIRDGQLGDRVDDLAFQFITPAFWRSLDALGGPASVEDVLQGTDYRYDTSGIQLPYASVRAVPARFRDVNILNTGRTA